MHDRHSLNTRAEHLGGDAEKVLQSDLGFALFLRNRNYSPAIPRIPRVSPETVILREHEIEQVKFCDTAGKPLRFSIFKYGSFTNDTFRHYLLFNPSERKLNCTHCTPYSYLTWILHMFFVFYILFSSLKDV